MGVLYASVHQIERALRRCDCCMRRRGRTHGSTTGTAVPPLTFRRVGARNSSSWLRPDDRFRCRSRASFRDPLPDCADRVMTRRGQRAQPHRQQTRQRIDPLEGSDLVEGNDHQVNGCACSRVCESRWRSCWDCPGSRSWPRSGRRTARRLSTWLSKVRAPRRVINCGALTCLNQRALGMARQTSPTPLAPVAAGHGFWLPIRLRRR